MTSLLSAPDHPTTRAGGDARHRRPLVLLATLGGAVAAGATLLVCLAVGVVGWFLTDAGAHGTPRDGLRVGALGWLVAHGSGVHVDGVALTAVPLGLTLICAWAVWRIGHRVGDSISGHGPDADRIADGERDWTVPVATALFAAGYLVVGLVTASLAATRDTAPSSGRVVLASLLLTLVVGGTAIAIGSGRAAIWTAFLPASVRATAATSRSIVLHFLTVSGLVLAAALVADFGTAVNVMSRLHADGGVVALVVALSLTLVPNATLFSGSYLLGPGFAVGAHTLVSPTVAVIGPLPVFPLLAALPDNGDAPAWTVYLMALPPLAAAVATARAQRRLPTLRWDEGALRGCAGGVVAGLVLGVLAALAGGAVGPGRMRVVGPESFDVLVHALTAFGIGGLIGGVAMTWWQRRAARRTTADG